MEMFEAECLLCRVTLNHNHIEEQGAGDYYVNLQRYFNFISLKMKINANDHANFSLCPSCQVVLKKFSKRHEKLEESPEEVNSSVQDICRVMLQADKEGVDFGAIREQIVDKGISFLEKGLRSNDNVAVRPRSKKANQPNHSMTSGKRGRQRKPLPSWITAIGKTRAYGTRQVLYRCSICKEDFPSVRLTQHRRHVILDQIEEEPASGFHDHEERCSSDEVTGTGTEAEEPNTQDDSDDDMNEFECTMDLEDFKKSVSSSSASSSPVAPLEPGAGLHMIGGLNQNEQIRDEMEIDEVRGNLNLEWTGIEAPEKESSSKHEDDMEVYAKNLKSFQSAFSPSSSSSADDINRNPVVQVQSGPSKDIVEHASTRTAKPGDARLGWLRGSVIQPGKRKLQKKQSSSSYDETTGENGSKRRKYFVPSLLPDFIFKIGRTFVYNQCHNLYHCFKCKVDVSAPHLNYHKKKHGIGLDSCKVCGKTFTRREYCLKHVARERCGGIVIAASSSPEL